MATRQPARRPRTTTPRKPRTATPRKPRTTKARAQAKSRSFPVAAAVGVATAAVAAIGFLLRRRARSGDGSFGSGEHAAPDLALGAAPADRAPEAFRPDPTAPVPPGERDALRPALGRPTLVESGRPVEPRADTAGGSTLSPQGGRVTEGAEDEGDILGGGTTLSEPARATGTGHL